MAADPVASLFSTPEMDSIFSASNQLRWMARFEWGLLSALEANGLAARRAASVLEALLNVEFLDLESLQEEAYRAGNMAIPFVRQLTTAVAKRSEEAARALHLGATSQDVLDTALVLQMSEAFTVIRRDLELLDQHLVRQIRTYADAALAGRTWLQDGPPVTLGLKIAGWLAAIRRHRERLDVAESCALVLQFGGAVGTLAALGDKGEAVSAALAKALDLREPDLPWHSHRDNLGEVGASLGLLAGSLGKIARDVSLLMQTEVAEVFEPGGEGRGGSSAMPHKRNPVGSAIILAAAARIPGLVATLLSSMVQEHERGLGGWQAEWETLPQIFRLTAASLARTVEIADGLEADRERMLANLEATRGLVMAEAVSASLYAHIGRDRAHELLQEASQRALREGKHLREVLLEMPEVCGHFSEGELDRLLEPRNYLGSAPRFIARVLGDSNAVR
jgi:3-carboxy-cis,cis-muconate cycloisomerase